MIRIILEVLKWFLISFVFINALSDNYQTEVFIKSNGHPVISKRLSKGSTDSSLECAIFCLKIESCSMITLNEMLRACLSYKIQHGHGLSNESLSTQQDIVIWYKAKTFVELLEISSSTTDVPLTSPVDCPAPFVRIGYGCYYADEQATLSWHDTVTNCQNKGTAIGHESIPAWFDDISVSHIFLR